MGGAAYVGQTENPKKHEKLVWVEALKPAGDAACNELDLYGMPLRAYALKLQFEFSVLPITMRDDTPNVPLVELLPNFKKQGVSM